MRTKVYRGFRQRPMRWHARRRPFRSYRASLGRRPRR